MKGNCKSGPLLMDGIKKINGNASKEGNVVNWSGQTSSASGHQAGVVKRLDVASLNPYLICALCSGYYVEATALVECLHTFCRSCIVKYLQSNRFCPICDVQIHQTEPWTSLRPDKILQDLVYKLVPGLYQDEMRRRRQFYSHLGRDTDAEGEEEGSFLSQDARFFSQDDSISLSLEYYNGNETEDGVEVNKAEDKKPNERPKRYLQCPAAVTVRHLKKFLRMKYGIGLDCWVDIIYSEECLPEDFSLIDVAYTFTWKRTSPMRFSYRICSKAALRAIKSQKNFQTPRVDDEDKKKSKNQSSLEQQMQNEYLGNFNLNPTNSSVCKTQTYNKTKSNTKNNNNNNSYVKNNNTPSDKKNKKDEYVFKDSQESEDGSRDKTFQSSEESNASGLQIILEKEESLKGNSEDSQELPVVEEASKKKSSVPVETFEEEAVDSFCVTKLLRNKHKSESKKQKKKLEESFRGEKRRKSAVEVFDDAKKKCSAAKRRKSVPEEYSLKREAEEKVVEAFSVQNEDEDVESLGNLKNEALRKVFVTKDKPETTGKRKDGEVRKKKRKKSKHHEGETKKRKTEMITSSPSIMSFAKDALKFKFKLTPNKPTIKVATEEEKKSNETHTENGNPEKEVKKSEENESKKLVTDKERLLHLRAVRHKAVVNKTSPKNYINTPPSLTISKIDSSEQQPVKSTLVESRPSLEITLVSPTDSSKTKKVELNHEPRKEVESPKVESSTKEIRQRSAEVVDNFGVLDLSEKSTRTKENNSNSSSPKEVSETVERRRKSTHQSILHIAQTLVNRKLSPILPENHLGRGGFEGSADSSATAAAMRNLKTLSDTAVNILMAAQSKNFPTCATELQKRSFSAISSAHKSLTAPNSTKPGKDCENGSGLKIPIYPGSRERSNPIPPIPNLHEIYPRGRGRPLPLTKPSTPAIKPGQNQTVRQIPNPFVVLNRQTSQNQNSIKSLSPPSKALLHSENGEDGSPAKQKLNSIPPLQSIKTKLTVPKLEDLKELNAEKNGSTEFKGIVPKIVNNNTKTVQNGSESNFFGLKNGGEERKSGGVKLNNNTTNSTRKIENMAKNIESVAAGLTARAVSNAMIDAK